MTEKPNINMRLTKKIAEKARQEAKRTHRTFSGFIAHVLEEYFKGAKK